jgi:ribose 1,5-bisphosphokinase PhnN
MIMGRSEHEEYAALIRNRVEVLRHTFTRRMRDTLRESHRDTLARMERARRSAAERGAALAALLEGSSDVAGEEWPDSLRDIEHAWIEYREAVERARLEMERYSAPA